MPFNENRRPLMPLRYLLVFWLFLLSGIAYLDRTNLSIAGIQIRREFGIDNNHLGWMISAFLIGYAAFQVPAGLLVHRFGSRLVLAAAVLWWGVFSALTAAVSPTIAGASTLLILVRFALGAGEAIMYPATSQFVERWFPQNERGRANGIIFAGVGVGSGVTPPLVTYVILKHGWHAAFWLSALIGVVAGLVWYLFGRDDPSQHAWISRYELDVLRSSNSAHRLKVTASNSKLRWSKLFGSRTLLALTTSYFVLGYVAWIFFGWFYIYLAQVRNVDLKSSALYSTLPFIGITVGCLAGGLLSDSLSRRYGARFGRSVLGAICFVLTAIFMLAGSRAQGAGAASLLLSCGAGFLYVPQGAFWAVAADFAGEYAGLSSGVMNMGSQIGGACTASLTPLIAAHFSWSASFATAAALAIVGATCWLAVDPSQRLMDEDTSARNFHRC